ncbi:SdpI family protein [Brevibacillus ginsengisoli]|uniref:SdpI family protein n=1 Tax=Brevibacillus ginsengisoli TaxID=363854 RepID=UPI003CEA4BFD
MNKSTKSWSWKDTLIIIIALVPVVIGAAMYNQLPEQMSSHFDMNGNANGFMSKPTFFIFMTLLNVFLVLLLKVAPKLDPKRANYEKFLDVYTLLRFVIVIFLSGIFVMVLLENLGYGVSIRTGTFLSLGGLWIVMGNYLGRIRHNYMLGIRTPWTLASEEVWRKTHRMAGPVWVICGIVMIFGSFFSGASFSYLFLITIGISVVLPLIYSYLGFKKLGQGK